jgi:hypothetical protein
MVFGHEPQGAAIKRSKNRALAVVRREHDHRCALRRLANRGQCGQPGTVGQVEVKQDQVRSAIFLPQHPESLSELPCLPHDGVPVVVDEHGFHAGADQGMIVDDQDVHERVSDLHGGVARIISERGVVRRHPRRGID